MSTRVGVANSYVILCPFFAAHHPHDYVPLGKVITEVVANLIFLGIHELRTLPFTSEDLAVGIIVCHLIAFLLGPVVHFTFPPRFKSST